MSEFLYRIQPTRPAMRTDGPTPEEREAIAAHRAYLERLVAAGGALLFGRTQTTDAATFGIVICRAGSPDEAGQVPAGNRRRPAVRASRSAPDPARRRPASLA